MNASAGTPPIVSLRCAAFGYADRAVVSGIDLDIRAGEAVGLLGPNGSGKSTLVKGVLGLNDHLDGHVRLFGTPFEAFHQRYRLGYVPQRHTLATSVRSTVAEIVAVGRLPRLSWWGRAGTRDRQVIATALELVGLGDRAAADVSTLSGGQQRRVLIARALAAEPDMLVMDEPTAGVDEASQQVLAEVLTRLASRGTTMLIVTHEVEALHGVLSRIVAMSNGRITFDGSPQHWADARAVQLDAALAADSAPDGHDHAHHDDDPPPRRSRSVLGPSYGPLDHARRSRHG